MGRSGSTSSCFKLIACGGDDSVDRDGLEALPESKGSSDRSRWSFRKRSARHRVLSNSVASEAPSGNKASPDPAIHGFPTQGSSTTPEKNSDTQWTEEKAHVQVPATQWTEEKTPLPVPNESKLSERTETIAAAENDKRADGAVDEGSVIFIQSFIRRFLAQRILVKHKNIVKLQAAVRGHIVRRHAVGSLRCVQAIVKMQNLVRERRARLLSEGSSVQEKGKENSSTKPDLIKHVSAEKLLSNGFARQLLESTPKTKTINIKCDPLKPDSAWKWLERWMSASSTETEQLHGLESTVEQQAKESIEETDNHVESAISSPENCQSRDEDNIEAFPVPLEADENVITYDVANHKFQECRPTESSAGQSMDQFPPQNTGETNPSASDSPTGHARELDNVSKIESQSLNALSELEQAKNIPVLDTTGIEGSEIDEMKSSTGSRKASNPAFVAAQAKFEELSSAASLGKSASSSNRDVSVDSSLNAELPVLNNASRTTETDHAENSSHSAGVQVNGSECGTELSISSTLDSPDRSEAGVVDSMQEQKTAEDAAADNPNNDYNLEVEDNIESKTLEDDASYSNSIVHEIDNSSTAVNTQHVSSVANGDSSEAEQKPITSARTDADVEQEIEMGHPVRGLSPEASPVSHVTIAESQGTPSSQVSVKSKKVRSKNGSTHKRLSTGKESHLESNQDYGGRNSSEHLPKEQKHGKRRNSFGSTKTDHSDQEPRDSNSSSSLPSYMQATESARAKALSHSSPRSSPDMQDKDLYIKKRHSLPNANTRQGSPRVHRAQQGAKGSDAHSPQERKWRR